MPTTTAEQTFVDLAGCLDLVDLVVLGDSLIRHGRTTPEQLISMTDSSSVRGAVRARKAARLVRVEVDSTYGARLRLLMMFAGLSEPVINYCILDGQAGPRDVSTSAIHT
ncbi:MAG: hypothetical protein ABI384_02245 [Allobranchiibius sp.]